MAVRTRAYFNSPQKRPCASVTDRHLREEREHRHANRPNPRPEIILKSKLLNAAAKFLAHTFVYAERRWLLFSENDATW